MHAQPLDEISTPDDDARLRPAEQLVAREADEVGTGRERLAGGGLAGQLRQHARAEIVEQRQAVPLRNRGKLLEPRLLREADDAEVRLVHAQQERRLGAHSLLVVLCARAVRRTDFDEPGARAHEHVGDAEAVADLDQLAARDDHLAALRECAEREQHRGGVVVHDERRLGAGQPPENRGDVILPRAARAVAQVELEVRVAPRNLDDLRERLGGERRAAEIRVHDHAGRIEDAAEARRAHRRQLVVQALREIARFGAGADLLARLLEHRARGIDREWVVEPTRELVHGGEIAPVDQRHVPPILVVADAEARRAVRPGPAVTCRRDIGERLHVVEGGTGATILRPSEGEDAGGRRDGEQDDPEREPVAEDDHDCRIGLPAPALEHE